MSKFNWVEKLKTNFADFTNDVIEEMVSLYGEEYRQIINERLNRYNFIFYGNTKHGIPQLEQNKRDKKSIIYKTKRWKCTLGTKHLIKELMSENYISKTTTFDFNNNSICFFVLIPLYVSDKHLIHEMIHAATTEPLLIMPEAEKYCEKTGLSVKKKEEETELLLEDCITEIEANIIYSRLKEKGKKPFIRDLDLRIPEHSCYYTHFLPLSSVFYEEFFNDITHARLTLNKNSLLEKIGEHNYEELIDQIKNFEKELKNGNENPTYLQLVEATIDKMKNNYKVKKLV